MLRRTRFAVWAAAVGVAAIVAGLAAFAVVREYRDHRSMGESTLRRAFSTVEGRLNRNLEGVDRLLAALPASLAAPGEPGRAASAPVLLSAGPEGSTLLVRHRALLDGTGRVRAADAAALLRDGVPVPAPLLEIVRNRTDATLVASGRLDLPGAPVALLRSVVGPDGQRMVAVALVPVERLSAALTTSYRGDPVELVVEGPDGAPLAATSAASSLPREPAPPDGEPHVRPLGEQGEAALVAARPLAAQGLQLVGALRLEPVLELGHGHAQQTVAAALATVLLLLVGAAVVDRRVRAEDAVRAEAEAARRHAEESNERLVESQALVASLLAVTQQGYWRIGIDGRTADVNPAMCSMLGRSRDDILGRTVFDFVDAEQAAIFQAELARRAAGERGVYEIVLQRPDGSRLPCINSAAPVRDATGRQIGSVGLWTDVSALKRTEQELAQAKSVLERALDAMSEGFVVYDRHDRLVVHNRRYLELFPHLRGVVRPGVALAEIQRVAAAAMLPDADAAARARWIAERAARHRADGPAFEASLPDGRIVEGIENTTPDGGFVGLFRDVTTTRVAQRELAQAKVRLEQALDAMSDGFVVFDPDDRLVLWNRRYVELFPYLRGVIAPGMHMDEIAVIASHAVMPDATEEERAAFRETRRRQRLSAAGAAESVRLAGVEVVAIDRRTPDGDVVTVFRDVTDERRTARSLAEARDAAEAAARAKSQFLAAMSHEIRTPLNAVLGLNGLLLESRLDDEQRRWAELIGRSGRSLLTVINDILEFSRLEAGRMSLEVVDFSVDDAVRDVVAMMTPHAQAKGLRIEAVGGPVPPLRGDPSRLRQVLFNLVGNAVKFTDRGGVRVEVSHGPQAEGMVPVAIAVSDTGIGITEAQRGRLFERFSQAESGTSRRYGGTGLGLAISREIVALMGGRIDVHSAPGQGTTFTVHLVLAPATAAPPRAEAVPRPFPRTHGLRILVAEDNAVNQVLARSLLGSLGHHADVVGDGAEAVVQLREAPYDLVLMDMQMPRMDGLEATRAIRALPGAAAHTPVIAMTANVLHEDREACLAAGMNGFVGKPIDRQELQDTIDATLATARRSPEPART